MLKALNQSFLKFFMVMHEFSTFQLSGDHLTFIKGGNDNHNLLNHLQSLTGSTTFIKNTNKYWEDVFLLSSSVNESAGIHKMLDGFQVLWRNTC